jgi:hypothetical protein
MIRPPPFSFAMHANTAPTWAGNAFGLSIRSEFELPGLEPGDGEVGERAVALALGAEEQRPDAGWGTRVQEWRYPDGPIGLAIDLDRDAGYRFFVLDVGVFELAIDGSRAVASPAPGSDWHWRRYLIGQVLPFAALLHGLEVFHASAVEIEGRAVALAGASGVGKSTLALNMHLAGAGFLTDDVLALEPRSDGTILAHPGIATAKVREGAKGLVAADERGVLGELVSENEHEARYEMPGSVDPCPLGAFCMLEASDGGEGIAIAEEPAAPLALLASTFNLLVQDGERLRRQLDVCTEIAGRVRYLRVQVPGRPDEKAAAKLADRLRALII